MKRIDIYETLLQHGPELGLITNILSILSTVILIQTQNLNNHELTNALFMAREIFSYVSRITLLAEVPLLIGSATMPVFPWQEQASLKRPERIGNYILTAANVAAGYAIADLRS